MDVLFCQLKPFTNQHFLYKSDFPLVWKLHPGNYRKCFPVSFDEVIKLVVTPLFPLATLPTMVLLF